MKYALLIYEDESASATMSPDDTRRVMDAYNAFGQEAGSRIQAGEGLQPTATATTVRVRSGERVLTDGPFAETREQLGGFYLVDVAGLDEALELAAKIPAAHTGTIEVRPVMDYEAMRSHADAASEIAS